MREDATTSLEDEEVDKKVVIDVKSVIGSQRYGGRQKVADIQNNKGITLLQVAGCRVNDKRITL